MNRSAGLVWAGLAVAGLVCGYAGRQGSSEGQGGSGDPQITSADGREGARVTDDSQGPRRKPKVVFQPSTLTSSDKLEDVLELPNGELYGRLALWMMDASEAEIAAFWKGYEVREERTNDINDLVFINWTRLNPKGAIEAVNGSDYEHYAWWAWACHDPEAALAEAVAAKSDRLNNVTWGIGEFHPEWAREHFDEIPEGARNNLLSGMAKWDDGDDPEATLDFLKEHGYGTDSGTLRLLARKDPWAAYEWVKKNGGGSNVDPFGRANDGMSAMIKTLSEEHPGMLEQLAEQTPSGPMKWEIEAALFENLMATDPEAAIEQAEQTESPRIAGERWMALATKMLASDPDRAFEMAEQLLSACPSLQNKRVFVRVDGGMSTSSRVLNGVGELFDSLIREDPGRLMAMVSEQSEGGPPQSAELMVARTWAQRDSTGLANWANEQEASPSRDAGVGALAQSLNQQARFQESVEWSMTISDPGRQNSSLGNALSSWKRIDPEAAFQWAEQADIPEEIKNRFLPQNR